MVPLMLFILVALAALAVSISRLGGDTATAMVQEAIALQALNAADSGAQYAMHRLLHNATLQSEVDTRCTALDGDSVSFSAAGLTGCQAQLSCALRTASGTTRHYYAVLSAAHCGGGQLTAERSVSVGTYFD